MIKIDCAAVKLQQVTYDVVFRA